MKIKRNLLDIKQEISECRDRIVELENEAKVFIDHCPHPEDFIHIQPETMEDEYGDYTSETVITYTCNLCTGRFVETIGTEERIPSLATVLTRRKSNGE